MKVSICDDDARAVANLVYRCEAYFKEINMEAQVTGKTSFPIDILQDEDQMPDLLLLDIEMPGMSGIQIKNELEQMKHRPYIIFVSSHEEQIHGTLGRNVIGFLKKPVTDEELWRQIDRAVQFYQEQFDLIAFEKGMVISCHTITSVVKNKTQRNCVEISSTEGIYICRKTLEECEKLLPGNDFFRIGKSSIVHLRFVQCVEKDRVILQDGTQWKLSREKKADFMAAWMRYLRRKGRVL